MGPPPPYLFAARRGGTAAVGSRGAFLGQGRCRAPNGPPTVLLAASLPQPPKLPPARVQSLGEEDGREKEAPRLLLHLPAQPQSSGAAGPQVPEVMERKGGGGAVEGSGEPVTGPDAHLYPALPWPREPSSLT